MTSQSLPLSLQIKTALIRSIRAISMVVGCAFALASMAGCKTKPPHGLEAAKNFDINKFEGIWHEIIRVNDKEELGLTRVTYDFRRTPDEKWLITTRAWKNAEGRWLGSQKIAKSPSTQYPASFQLGHGHPRHVVIIDNDHSLAVMCGKNYREFWVISKNPNPDPNRLGTILGLAEAAGFPVKEAFFVPTR
jgi:apolipoprotein D and lipocalin family protein